VSQTPCIFCLLGSRAGANSEALITMLIGDFIGRWARRVNALPPTRVHQRDRLAWFDSPGSNKKHQVSGNMP